MAIKILVVEDDQDVLDGLQKDLSALGYEVDACASSQESVEKLSVPGMDYDIVVLDWMLESPNGSSLVIEAARMSIPDFPVIVFTGDPNDNSPRAIQKGASWYVRKPFDLAELKSIIQSLTEQDANLRHIAKTAQEIIGSDQILIWRSYDQNRELKLAAWADPSSINETDKLEVIQTGGRNMLRIFREEAPSFLEEIHKSSKYHSPQFAARHPWSCMAAVPLRFHGKQFGLLESYWIKQESFLAEPEATVARNIRAFARQVAESINNSEQAKKNRLLINGISSLAAEQPRLEIFTEAVLKLAVDLVGADEGWFYILDFGNNVLRRLNPEPGQKSALASQYQLDEVNLLCDAVREGTIKVVSDVKNPSHHNGNHPFQIKKYRSEAAIPLKRGEQTIGAVILASRIPAAFLEMDIDSLRSFAMLSGSALDQAKLRFYLQYISQAVLKGQDALQNAVIDAIHELLGKSVALWLWDEELNEFTVPAARGVTKTFKQKAHIKFSGEDDSLIAHAFLTRQPVNCGDLEHPEEGLSVKLDTLLRIEKWRSALLVPIFSSEDQPIGAISIKRDVVGKFTQYEVDFLKNFTSQVAIAFENHRRRLSLTQQLDAFQDILRTVGIDGDDPLAVILEKAAHLLGAHFGSFAILDPLNDRLEYRAVWENGKILTGSQIQANRRYQSLDEGIVGYVARSQEEIYYVPDLSKKHEYYLRRYPDTVSELAVALKNKQGETIGVLNLESKWKDAFSLQQRALCQSLAQIGEEVVVKSQLFDRMENLNRQLEVLHNMFQEGEFVTILEQVLRGIIDLYGSKSCSTSITIFDENSQRFLPTTVAIGPLADALRFPPRLEGGLAWYVAKNREPLYIENKGQLPPEIQDFNTELKKAGVNSSAVLPLKRQDLLLGVLFIHEKRETKYRPELQRFLQIYANQAAVLIENALTFDHRKKDLEALRQVVNVIGTPEPLPLVLEKAVQILEADHGHISVVKDELLVHIASWQDGRVVSSDEIPPDMRSLGKYQGITGHVVRTREIYYAADLDENRDYYLEYFEDTRSELTLPLKSEDGEVIGVLNLESRHRNGFPSQKQALAMSLAQIAADILNKQGLSRRLDLLNQQLDSLHEVTQGNTIDDIADKILNSINNILGLRVTSSSMVLYDQASDEFTLCKAAGPLKDHLELTPRGKGGKSRFMLAYRKPLFEPDVMSPPNNAPRFREDSLKLGIKSSAILPLIYGSRLIGILFVHQTVPIDFDDQLQNLLIRFADQAAVVLETNLVMQQQVDYLSTLQEINSAIGKESLQAIYAKIVKKTRELTGGTASSIWLLNKASNLLELGDSAGLDAKEKELPLDHHSINGHVAITRRPYLCADVTTDSHYRRWYPEIRSSLTIPMLYGTQVIGTLDVESTTPNAFNTDQQELIQALGNLAAIALMNAQSYERRVNDIVTLGRINAAVGEQSPGEIQRMVVAQAVELTGADYGVLWQLDGSGRQLNLLAIDGREAIEETLQLESDTVHGKVVEERKAIIVDETDDDYRAWYTDIKSHMQVPMFAGEKLIGTLQVESVEKEAFTNDQMNVLQALANQAGIAFEKDRWLTELTELNRAGRKISNAASSQPSTPDQSRLAPILQQATEEIKELLKTDATSIWLYDSPSGDLVCEYATPDSGEVKVQGTRLKPEVGLVGWCYKNNETLIIADAFADERHFSKVEEDTKAGLHSIASIPLRSEDRVIGVLQVLHKQMDYFQPGHIALLEPLAAFTTNAIETGRQIERMQYINELGNELTSVRTEPELYALVHTRAKKIMYATNMFIAIYEPKKEKQISFPMMVLEGEEISQAVLAAMARPFGKGLTEEVIHARQPVLMKTKQEQEIWYAKQGINYIDRTFASWLGVPIMYANQVLGVIATYPSQEEHKYSEDDKQLLSLIAGQMAVALKNLREVNALQELSDNLLKETASLWGADPGGSAGGKI